MVNDKFFDTKHRFCDKSEEEIFKPIKGWDGLYEISSYGRVLSLRSKKILSPHINKKNRLLSDNFL